MSVFLGLVALGLFWIGSLCALTWSWDRSLQRALAAGVEILSEHRSLKLRTVLWLNIRSHTVGWSAFYFCFFVLLGLADFPVWQRLGIGGLLALYYGYLRESRETGQYPDRPSLFSPSVDRVWYFTILSAEWFGYYGVLILAGQVLVGLLK
jgi:hypothetical protein